MGRLWSFLEPDEQGARDDREGHEREVAEAVRVLHRIPASTSRIVNGPTSAAVVGASIPDTARCTVKQAGHMARRSTPAPDMTGRSVSL